MYQTIHKLKFYCVIYPLIILFFFRSDAVIAQYCPEKQLEEYHNHIRELVINHKPLVALFYADSILHLLNEKNLLKCEKTFWIRLELGEANELNGKFEEALSIYQDLIKLGEKKNLWKFLADVNLSMARSYETIGRQEDCLRHLEGAKKIIDERQLDTAMARYCTRYSSYHRIYDNTDSAIIYAQKSIEYGKRYQVTRSVVDGHLLMGILAKNLDSSIYHLQQAVQIFTDREDYNGVASQLMNICSKLIENNKLDTALIFLRKAHIAISATEKESKAFHRSMSRYFSIQKLIFEKKGFIDSAYHYAKKEFDSYKRAEWFINQESITKKAIEFAIEKEKERRIVLEKNSEILRIGMLMVSILAIIAFILLVQNIKSKKAISDQNRIIQSQNEILEQSLHKQSLLLSEIHHRVKNNLQLIISLLTLHGKDSKSDKIKMFLEEVSSKVSGIALIHEQLYSTGNFEHIDICQYLKNLINQYKEFYNDENEFECSIIAEQTLLNLETVMPIGVICSELLGNSIKYARIYNQKLKVNISLETTGDKYLFKYADNGPGIPENKLKESTSSLGLVLIKSMARQLQAECRFFNDQGAHFNMIFVEKKTSVV